MAYSSNWFRHLLAPLTGDGFGNHLARDFWSEEDLWDPAAAVARRGLKLWWVYSASAVTQITLPGITGIFIIDALIRDVPLRWRIICIGLGTAFGLILASIIAVLTTYGIQRRAREQKA